MQKSLFIPLKTEYFEAFESGKKTVELRALNDRWNLKVCRIGRSVLLSKGYGKHHRLKGYVGHAEIVRGCELELNEREAVKECYGNDALNIVRIRIDGLQPVETA
ncbi:MAG: hypothetical protein JEY79_01175 [Pseudodesulfovibrio sp.]|nr:hypothetical protein [Pseudodesulfovibrio sp.]